MADSFTRLRFDWLDQVCADQTLKRTSAFQVAYLLSCHLNREKGVSWPSQETLANALGLTVRAIQTCLAALAARGHLEIQSGKGRRQVSRYRPIIKAPENPKCTSSFSSETVQCASPFEPENTKSSAKKHEVQRKKTRSTLPTELFEELSEEHNERGALIPKEKPVRKKPATPVPENYPSAEAIRWAEDHLESEGRPDIMARLESVAARFRDYHLANDLRRKDWPATWRNWVRKECDFSKPEEAAATGAMSAARGIFMAASAARGR